MYIYLVFVIIGFLLLIKGADLLVEGASNIAKKFNIPTLIIGLTIVAVGTSMPELMVSTTASIEGHSDISIGNVVGSNIANLFLILGVCSIIRELKFEKETEKCGNLIAIFATVLLFIFGKNGNNIINRGEGIILLTCTLLFILYNIFTAQKSKNNTIIELESEDNKEISSIKSIIQLLIGIVALKIGGDVVVQYASKIAEIMGLSEKLISVTVIAFSTSLPELITSVTATIKKETDMAIGNILGSQIFNIFLIIGISASLCPIKYSLEYDIDMMFLVFGTILFALFPFIGKKHFMTRQNGLIFVLIYMSYLTYTVLKIL